MSIKFNDTQLVLLRAASQRDDHCLVPPTGPKRGQAQKAIVKLLEAGIVKEIRAKAGAPIWRRGFIPVLPSSAIVFATEPKIQLYQKCGWWS